jgi:hypothetical protein
MFDIRANFLPISDIQPSAVRVPFRVHVHVHVYIYFCSRNMIMKTNSDLIDELGHGHGH